MYVHVKSDTGLTRFIATLPEAGYFAPSVIQGWVQLTNWTEKKTYVSDSEILNEANIYAVYEDLDRYYFYDSSKPGVYYIGKTETLPTITSFDDYGLANKIYYYADTDTYWHYVWNYEPEIVDSIPSAHYYSWTKIEKIVEKETLPTVGTAATLYHITTNNAYYYWDTFDKCWRAISNFKTINETDWNDYTAVSDYSECVTVKCYRDTDNKEYPLMYIPTNGYELGWIRIYNWTTPKTIGYEYEVFRDSNQHLAYKNLLDNRMYIYAAHKPGYQTVTATKVSALPAAPYEDLVYHRTTDDTYWYYCYNYSLITPNNTTSAIWRKPLYCKYFDSVDDLPADGSLEMIACVVEDATNPADESYYIYDINIDTWTKFEFKDANISEITGGSPSEFDKIYNATSTYQGNDWHTYWVGTDVSTLQPDGNWVQITNYHTPQEAVSLDAFTNAGNNKLIAVISSNPSQKYLYKSYMPGTLAVNKVVDVNYALPPGYGEPNAIYHRKADNTYWHFEFHWKSELFPPELEEQSWNKIYNIKYLTSKIGETQEYNLYVIDNIKYWIDPEIGDWMDVSSTGKEKSIQEDDWAESTDATKLYAVHSIRGGFDFTTYWTIKAGKKDSGNWVYITNFDEPENVTDMLAIYDKANKHLLYQIGGPDKGWIQIENYEDPIVRSMDDVGWISSLPQNTLYMNTDNMRYGNQGEYPGSYAPLTPALGNVIDCETLPVGNIYQGIYHRVPDDTYWTYCYDFTRSESYVPTPPTGYKWVHPTAMFYSSGGNFPIQGVEGVLYKSASRRSVWYDGAYHATSPGSARFRTSQWETYNKPENAGKAYEVWIDRPTDCEVASNYAVIWYLQPTT